jgi:hypothetical protein
VGFKFRNTPVEGPGCFGRSVSGIAVFRGGRLYCLVDGFGGLGLGQTESQVQLHFVGGSSVIAGKTNFNFVFFLVYVSVVSDGVS